jgi:hypothetical protein
VVLMALNRGGSGDHAAPIKLLLLQLLAPLPLPTWMLCRARFSYGRPPAHPEGGPPPRQSHERPSTALSI